MLTHTPTINVILNEVRKVSTRLASEDQTLIQKVVGLVYRADFVNEQLQREAQELREYKRRREAEDAQQGGKV